MRVRRNAYAGRLWLPARAGNPRARPEAPDARHPERVPAGPLSLAGGRRSGTSSLVRGKIEPLGCLRRLSARDATPTPRSPRRASSHRGAARGRRRRARRRAAAGRARAGERARRAGGGAAARHGARRGRAADARRSGTTSRRSGLAHILAVSGQNVMLLAVLVLGGVRAGRRAAAGAAAARGGGDRRSTCRLPGRGRRSSARG